MQQALAIVPIGRVLHARPAMELARSAAAFRSVITIENLSNGRGPVNARSVVSLLSIGAMAGAALRIAADGVDATEALAAMLRECERLLQVEAPV